MKENKNIHEGHRRRLKEMIDKTNASNLSDIHFLEYLLTFIIPRADTNPIAHRLLSEFKSIANIFNANETALRSIDGIGNKASEFLHFMPIVHYFYKKSLVQKNAYVGTINTALNFIQSVLPPSHNEQFIVLILNKNYEIKSYKIFNGVSHSYINFDAQELSSFFINHKASFCILAHTHPYASANPSGADLETYRRLTPLIDSLAIKLLDNLILGENDYFSSNLSETYPYSYTNIDYTKLRFMN